jgi:TRAP-type C4-dicarboxylate transport system substrate-binding protein
MQDMMSEGVLDMASFGNAIPINYNPQYQLLSMPFLWKDSDQMMAFASSDIQAELNENYRKAAGIKVLSSNWDMGARNVIATHPIEKVSDFKGLKMRVPQVPAWVDVWQMLGCNVVSTSWSELYPAMQQGVADAAEVPWFWVKSGSLQEIAKCGTTTGHIRYFNQILMNDKLYQSIPEEYRTIIIDCANEAGDFESKLTRDSENKIKADLVAAGVTFYEIDIQSVMDATKPVYEKWQSTYGKDLLDRVNAFKAKN